MTTFKICFFILFFTQISATLKRDFNDYSAQFVRFAQNQNPFITEEQAKGLAERNWELSFGNWALARRLAGKEATESRFRVLAFLPDGTPTKGIPRADCLGSHYNLIAQEARKLDLLSDSKNWYYSDEFDALKKRCWEDPAWGTWLVGHAYVREAQKVGLDRASHWWQTGKSWFKTRDAYIHDPYLNTIWQKERLFDRMSTGLEPKTLTKFKAGRPQNEKF